MNYLLLLFLACVLAVVPQEASSFSSSSLGRGQIRALTTSISTSTPYQYKSSCLSLSSTTNGDDADGNSNKKIQQGRKNRVVIGYKIMMISYLAVGYDLLQKSD